MFFDHTYLVNLPQHRGRCLKTLAHLKTYGIVPEVFEASNGYVPPLLNEYEKYSNQELGSLTYFTDFNELEVSRKKHYIETAGAFGYISTYIKLLKDAKSKGYESILIFEDDVILSKDFNERLETFCSSLPKTWKFVGLGASQYDWSSVGLAKAESQGFYTPKQLHTCGSFAIAIHSRVFDELIELQSLYEAPFDHLPLGEIYDKYPSDCFITYPYMVMPDVRDSSIRGSRSQLIHAKKMKWDPSLFEYPLKRPIINLILSSKEEIKYLESFNDEITFPFELHLFIPSLDGLRPYHNQSQNIESIDAANKTIAPNSGYCIRSNEHVPITEASLISLFESLELKQKPTAGFEVLDTLDHIIDSDKVSVIIPTFKRADNLATVIMSVIEQDYENKEIIVVDDNPRQSEAQLDTERVVTSLIKEHPDTNLIYISQTRNRNGAAARNTGFMRSTGNYICYLDDDDMYLPGRLSLSIEKLKTTPSYIGAVYCGFLGWNGATHSKKRYKKGNLTSELLTLDYLSHYLHTNTATYKRDAVITLDGFDETFIRHQDIEFNLRFFEHYDMDVVEKQLIHLRPKPTNTNNQQFGVALFETKLKFLEKFEYVINRFDYATKNRIYEEHWSEVVKYIPNDSFFKKKLSADISNGHIQCLLKVIDNQKILTKDEIKADESIVKDDFDGSEQEIFSVSTANNLNFWQIKGANIFGVLFRAYIMPHHRDKLRNQPEAFFKDSKNDFARLVGRLLKIL